MASGYKVTTRTNGALDPVPVMTLMCTAWNWEVCCVTMQKPREARSESFFLFGGVVEASGNMRFYVPLRIPPSPTCYARSLVDRPPLLLLDSEQPSPGLSACDIPSRPPICGETGSP